MTNIPAKDAIGEVRVNTARHLSAMMLRNLERHLSRLDTDDCAHRARKLSDAVELAYGLLWLAPDTEDPEGRPAGFEQTCTALARLALLEHLDRAGQARGIEAARHEMAGDDL